MWSLAVLLAVFFVVSAVISARVPLMRPPYSTGPRRCNLCLERYQDVPSWEVDFVCANCRYSNK
jgi:hypothetical protein